jgi:hypothetical protein
LREVDCALRCDSNDVAGKGFCREEFRSDDEF